MQLKRRHTIKRASEFAMVRSEGKSEAGRFLILGTAPYPKGRDGEDHRPSRFGIIATRKIGKAVVRNRLRRQMREILRAHAAPLSKGLSVALIIRKRAITTDYRGLEKDFLNLLTRQQRALRQEP